MNLKDGSSVVADLTTTGRKTGQPRRVGLRFVYYQGCFFSSSARVQGKHWGQNMLHNPLVELRVKRETLSFTAPQGGGEGLRGRILSFRGLPPLMDRVVFGI